MSLPDPISIPAEVQFAAMKISRWMTEQGHTKWELLMISETGITRSRALRFAWGELSSPYWCGPRQIIFVHESGEVELWTPATLSA